MIVRYGLPNGEAIIATDPEGPLWWEWDTDLEKAWWVTSDGRRDSPSQYSPEQMTANGRVPIDPDLAVSEGL